MEVCKDIAYRTVGQVTLRLDIYRPSGAGPWPVVLYIHGGSWRAYDRTHCSAAWLAEHGFAVASIDYRKSWRAIFPAQIHDCKAAVRWVRANAARYGLEGRRVGVWGGSSGGHLAALLGTSAGVSELEGTGEHLDQSSAVDAVCAVCAPVDFPHVKELYERRPGKTPDQPGKEPIRTLLGGTVDEKPELAKLASPISHVAANAGKLPPFLLIHAEPDLLVPTSQSRRMHEALQAAGGESKLHIVRDEDHGFELTDRERELVLELFERYLRRRPR